MSRTWEDTVEEEEIDHPWIVGFRVGCQAGRQEDTRGGL